MKQRNVLWVQRSAEVATFTPGKKGTPPPQVSFSQEHKRTNDKFYTKWLERDIVIGTVTRLRAGRSRNRGTIPDKGKIKADSHTACRSHAAKGLECVFPIWFTQCGRVWLTLPMPCPCYALTMPFFKATAQHVRQQTACGLPARFRLLPATTKVIIRRIPVSDAGGQCETKHRLSWTRKRVVAAHYKKDDLLHSWTISLDISGYHADFHEGHGTIGAGQGRGIACVN